MNLLWKGEYRMKNSGQIRPFLMTSQTLQGFHSLASKTLALVSHVSVVKNGSVRAKTALFQQVSAHLLSRGCTVEVLCSRMESTMVEGIIVPESGLAIVDGPACVTRASTGHGIDIDLDDYCDPQKLRERQAETRALEEEVKRHAARHALLVEQLAPLHKEIEAHYVAALDFSEADARTDRLLAEIFRDNHTEAARAQPRYFFAGGWYPMQGRFIDFRPQLTAGYGRRIIVKGRGGTGKSTLMRKVADKAIELGYSVEIYPCSFDLESLDGVVIPALSTAMFDGTPIHVLEPERMGDEILDMYECVRPERLDEKAVLALEEREQEYLGPLAEPRIATYHAWKRLASLQSDLVSDAATSQVAEKAIAWVDGL